MQKEPLGRLSAEKLSAYKVRLLGILKDGGHTKEVNEYLFFYDYSKQYQGYCLKKDWEELLVEQ